MNWRAILNFALSTITAGIAVFLTVAFAGGVPTGDSIKAGIAGGVAAAVNHVRQNPFKL